MVDTDVISNSGATEDSTKAKADHNTANTEYWTCLCKLSVSLKLWEPLYSVPDIFWICGGQNKCRSLPEV